MKTKEELTALKEEDENMSKGLEELRDEELTQVSGGLRPLDDSRHGADKEME